LVLKFDLVIFDEVAGANFKLERNREMYKGYMVEGLFLEGDDDGLVRTLGKPERSQTLHYIPVDKRRDNFMALNVALI
jgi:hypothetical protein